MKFKKQNKQALQIGGAVIAKQLLLISIVFFKKNKTFTFNTWLKLIELEKKLKKELLIK